MSFNILYTLEITWLVVVEDVLICIIEIRKREAENVEKGGGKMSKMTINLSVLFKSIDL